MIVMITKGIHDKDAIYNTRNCKLYTSFEELEEDIKKEPMEITRLITTSDMFVTNIKENANKYANILSDRFLRVHEKIHLVNNRTSGEVTFLEFLNLGIEVREIEVTQENLIAILSGKYDLSNKSVGSFVVKMYPKSEYMKIEAEKARKEESDVKAIQSKDLTEGVSIEDLSQVELSEHILQESLPTKMCSLLYTKQSSKQVLEFAAVYSQIVSRFGKTVIIEDDPIFLPIYHYLSKTTAKYFVIDIFDFLANTDERLLEIQMMQDKLIIFTFENQDFDKRELEKHFYKNVITRLLDGKVDFIISTGYCTDTHIGNPCIGISTDLIDILKSINDVPLNIDNMKFVFINDNKINESQVSSAIAIEELMTKIFGVRINPILVELGSLQGGVLENELYLFN